MSLQELLFPKHPFSEKHSLRQHDMRERFAQPAFCLPYQLSDPTISFRAIGQFLSSTGEQDFSLNKASKQETMPRKKTKTPFQGGDRSARKKLSPAKGDCTSRKRASSSVRGHPSSARGLRQMVSVDSDSWRDCLDILRTTADDLEGTSLQREARRRGPRVR